MKDRIKKFVVDHEEEIKLIAVGTVVATALIVVYTKKINGMEIVRGHMDDDENTFTVFTRNGSRYPFSRPGTK